jgi:signal transduction histidine kinase
VARSEWKYVAEMTTDFDPSLPAVLCYEDEFHQAILNILVNAAQAIAEVAGERADAKGTITVTTRRLGPWAEIRIADTGPGIPAAIRPRIFEPFFTTKEVGKGTGQGLALAHATIVRKHGGALTFETQEGKGTTFIIRLPLQPDDERGDGAWHESSLSTTSRT